MELGLAPTSRGWSVSVNWCVWLVVLIGLNRTNQKTQMNQPNQAIDVLGCKNVFRSLLGREYTV